KQRGDQWSRIDQSIALYDKTVVGHCLNSIDGFGTEDVYVVGSRGEAFHYNGAVWRQIDCPTNVALRQVVCPPDDDVHIVGARGTILIGNKDRLSVASDPEMTENIWGVARFQGRIYVSSARTVYRVEKTELKEVPIGLPRDGSLLRLVASKKF